MDILPKDRKLRSETVLELEREIALHGLPR
jgi:hypothetical protein